MRRNFSYVLFFVLACLINACSSSPDVKGREFELESVVKNDIDLITEAHQQEVFKALKRLAIKLYKRNPAEWKKGFPSLQAAVDDVSSGEFPAVKGRVSVECIRLAFDEKYSGDRVRALIAGLQTMVLKSYNGDRKFYVYSLLDAQKLYDSARNIELASWLLRNKKDQDGNWLLLSLQGDGEINLSFERLFGKMIHSQDMMAKIIADRNHRQIKYVIQTVVTAFIPI